MALVAQHAYRGAWHAAESLVTWYIKRKDLQRGVLPALTAERFGHSKPPGTFSSLGTISCANRYFVTDFTFSCVAEWQQHTDDEYFTLWIHGASVGETLSGLPLIELVLSDAFLRSASGYKGSKKKTKARVLLSTTTPAARKLLSERLSVVRSALLHEEAHMCRSLTYRLCTEPCDLGGEPEQRAVRFRTTGPSQVGPSLLRDVETRVRRYTLMLAYTYEYYTRTGVLLWASN